MSLRELRAGSVAPAVEALLPLDLPTRPRALAVIDGALAGRIWTDDPGEPTWALVIETADGTLYGGGAVTPAIVLAAVRGVETASGDVVIGFSGPDDPMRACAPPDPSYVGEALDFTDRVPPPDEDAALAAPPPAGLQVADLDLAVLPLTEWYTDTLHAFGSADGWTELGVGRVLLDGRAAVAEAMAGPRVRGLLEMGVATRGSYRRRGCGTYLSRLVARACEARGDRVWWNTSATNLPSQRIARALGFRTERRYDLVAYRTDALGR